MDTDCGTAVPCAVYSVCCWFSARNLITWPFLRVIAYLVQNAWCSGFWFLFYDCCCFCCCYCPCCCTPRFTFSLIHTQNSMASAAVISFSFRIYCALFPSTNVCETKTTVLHMFLLFFDFLDLVWRASRSLTRALNMFLCFATHTPKKRFHLWWLIGGGTFEFVK